MKSPIRKKIEQMLPNTQTSFSPLGGIQSDSLQYSSGKSKAGQKYNRRVTIRNNLNREFSFSLWAKEDDTEMTTRLKTPTDSCRRSRAPKATIEHFDFQVSSRKLVKSARSVSQNQVKGISAKEHFRLQGLKVEEGVETHWAHRQACIFGGKQVPGNLDATTAICNQETRFYVEGPVQQHVKSGRNSVSVNGTVFFRQACATKIQYNLRSQNGNLTTVNLDGLGTVKTPKKERQIITSIVKAGLKGF